MKRLVRENPQHFVRWFLQGAQFKDFLSVELKSWTIEADALLCVVLVDEKELLLHIEFQSTEDTNTEKMIEKIVAEQPGLLEWAKLFAWPSLKRKPIMSG